MNDGNAFSSLLIHELKYSNLLPSFYEFSCVNRSVISQGRKELISLRKAVGVYTWWRGFFATRQWYFNYSGIAGWGYHLSTYVNAPLKLSASQNEIVGHLAALSSIIITLYDFLLDQRLVQKLPISQSWLKDTLQQEPGVPRNTGHSVSNSNQLLFQLIQLFLTEIYRLPHVKDRPEILSHLKKSILKMYEAENQTVLCAPHDINKYKLVRKSAFPFVIMGLTAWLVSSSFDKSLYRWHLRWLYEIGTFFSLVDDTVDLRFDRARGAPNLFIHYLDVDSINQAAWARKIARKGKDLHVQWWRRVHVNSKVPSKISLILPSCLASWLLHP